MRFKTMILVLAVLFVSGAGRPPESSPLLHNGSGSGAAVTPDFSRVPLYFIPNRGQLAGDVLFYAKTPAYTLGATEQGLSFGVLTLEFVGTRPHPRLSAGRFSGHRVNLFLGNDPSQWRTDIPSSLDILYTGLYPDIDLRVYGKERTIEYDWIVRPGGRPEKIRFAYRETRATRLDRAGNILVETPSGTLLQRKPAGYQEIGGRRVPVDARFADLGSHAYGIQVGDYDARYPLVIDPVVLVYSTYLGGSSRDKAYSVAVDSAGCAYVVGSTESPNFPVKNPADGTLATMDAFLTKFTASGTALVYSTFYGGSGAEEAYGVALGPDKSAYIVGRTSSSNLPVKSAYDPTPNGSWDAFVAKFSPSGNVLRYATYLGGSGIEYGFGIAVDRAGAAYVAGTTMSMNFPVLNAFDNSFNGGAWDGFVTKLARSGSALLYSTYLGGEGDDSIYDIAVDKAKAAYLTGSTTSVEFPTANAFDHTKGTGEDAFVTKLTPGGGGLVYSTYLGGNGDEEEGTAIVVDATGAAYVTGHTNSRNFPVKNAYDPTPNGSSLSDWDAFVTKFTPAGNILVFSTYLGGRMSDDGRGIAVLGNGTVYVAGYTFSDDFPTLKAFDDELDGPPDVFVTGFKADGSHLLYSTYLGGSDSGEWAFDLALHGSGTPYVVGETMSTNFPRKNAFDNTYNGTVDAFVTRLKYK
jgi:hypothetical protein